MRSIPLYTTYCTRITAALAALCAVAVFAYGALLLMAVSHAVRQSRAEASIRAVSASMSTLESTYLAGQKTLTLERALELGFVRPAEGSVVYASPSSLTVNR